MSTFKFSTSQTESNKFDEQQYYLQEIVLDIIGNKLNDLVYI